MLYFIDEHDVHIGHIMWPSACGHETNAVSSNDFSDMVIINCKKKCIYYLTYLLTTGIQE